MADWHKLSALIVGLGVDPDEGLESMFLQCVLCLTTRSQHLCHRGMPDHRGMLQNSRDRHGQFLKWGVLD